MRHENLLNSYLFHKFPSASTQIGSFEEYLSTKTFLHLEVEAPHMTQVVLSQYFVGKSMPMSPKIAQFSSCLHSNKCQEKEQFHGLVILTHLST